MHERVSVHNVIYMLCWNGRIEIILFPNFGKNLSYLVEKGCFSVILLCQRHSQFDVDGQKPYKKLKAVQASMKDEIEVVVQEIAILR